MAKMIFCLYDTLIERSGWMQEKLKALGHEAIFLVRGTDMTPYLDGVEAIGVTWEFLDGRFMDKCPTLKHLAAFGVGYNQFDMAAATERGITISNTPGVNKQSTAEIAVALMLCAARHAATSNHYMKNGQWYQPVGLNLGGKTLGIIGTGNVGATVARICHHGFGMKIIANDVYINEDLKKECDVEYMEVDELLPQADFISLHMPVLPETMRMIDERRFKMMKKTAVFVNASRGLTIDEAALEKAIKEKWIYAAGLDVYNKEPTEDKWYMNYDNIATFSHIGGHTEESYRNMCERAIENMLAAVEGKVPPDTRNPEALKNRK